jgi:transcriptional regulator with XRE-family HTH domain/dephospho-CoA kinase/Zn-dependent peptidase ImmA (M78 family)
MIKNERQYRITRSQAQKFQAAIRELEETKPAKNVSPVLHKAQIDALRSQLVDLEEEIADYEALREGKRPVHELQTIEQIPAALIQSRIAGGLSQEQLAERLGLKPQQIQRYEATEYRAASLARVVEVARALRLPIREGLLPSEGELSIARMFERLRSAGLSEEFVKQRLLPKAPGLIELDEEAVGANDVAIEVAEGVNRIFGWTPAVLFGGDRLDVAAAAAASARFKLPARLNEAQLAAYVVYAHYLGLLVLEATKHLETRSLPQDAGSVRRAIVEQYGELSFETGLKYVCSLGVPVLPLNDPGTFHGACWRVNGRNVIVLKQRTRSIARWLHDLLHEYFHAANNPDLEEHPIIEESEMSASRRESEDEQAASQFAGDVMLDGRAEELAEECVKAAKRSVEKLKSAVGRVAKENQVPVDVLANYVAFRLSLQGINWWGAANNLQPDGTQMLRTPREVLLGHANLVQLNPIDRSLLLRALEPQVLAFSGKIGSGKSTLSQEVAHALQWKRASFGDYVRTVAKSEGLEPSRDVLQELGASLAKKPEEFCRAMLAHYGWQSGEPLVIDGVRHKEILDALRRIVAPLEVRVVYLAIDDQKRHERLMQEDQIDEKKLGQVEAHSTEKQVMDVLPKIADLTVSAERPIEDLVRDIVTWVHQADGVQEFAA